MNQEYFKSWTALVNELQKPFQAMMELNMRTLQNMDYLRLKNPTDWQQPNHLLDAQMKMAMENSHRVLEYMRHSFQILEGVFSSLSRELHQVPTQQRGRSVAESIEVSLPAVRKKRKTASSKTASAKKAKTASASKSPVAAKKAKSTTATKKKTASKKASAKTTDSSLKAKAATKKTAGKAKPKAKLQAKAKPAAKKASAKVAKSTNAKSKVQAKTNAKSKVKSNAKKTNVKASPAGNRPTTTFGSKSNIGSQSTFVPNRTTPHSGVNLNAAKLSAPHHSPASVFKSHSEKAPEPKK